jgi:hypothetical protein
MLDSEEMMRLGLNFALVENERAASAADSGLKRIIALRELADDATAKQKSLKEKLSDEREAAQVVEEQRNQLRLKYDYIAKRVAREDKQEEERRARKTAYGLSPRRSPGITTPLKRKISPASHIFLKVAGRIPSNLSQESMMSRRPRTAPSKSLASAQPHPPAAATHSKPSKRPHPTPPTHTHAGISHGPRRQPRTPTSPPSPPFFPPSFEPAFDPAKIGSPYRANVTSMPHPTPFERTNSLPKPDKIQFTQRPHPKSTLQNLDRSPLVLNS